ncbi:MAG: MarP family serine protease [Chloroflexi bacterium]|nr:MarP family serine protease [Chloroflexota bacterium]
MNPLDAGAIALLLLAVLLGWRSGALPQVAGLIGAGLGVVIGMAILPSLLPMLEDVPTPVRAGAVMFVLVGGLGVGESFGGMVGRRASGLLGTGLLGALDRVAGAVVGAGQAVLILWLAGGILATGAVPSLGRLAQRSVAIRGLAAVLPPPTAIVLELGKAFDESGLPDVFLGLERLPAAPVDLPADPIARALGERVAASVLRIRADACEYRSAGSGFIVAANYVVTNAHVVAGARAVSVEGSADRRTAQVVFFDPRLDVALLYVPGLGGSSLVFATTEPGRGAVGATFGYPGGGNAVVTPAAVTGSYTAEGLDITGTVRVSREIIELRAQVDPGDSGGPLLLTDGTVGGLVFAESRSDDTVGYALSPVEVAVAIRPSIGRTAAVDDGPCIR